MSEVEYPKIVTIDDVVEGCHCAVIELVGEITVIRCVTCPVHGDWEFRK